MLQSTLNALLLQKYGCAQSKSEFRDVLCIRFGRRPKDLSVKCPRGVEYALYFRKRGSTHYCPAAIRDIFAQLLDDVYYDA